MTDTIELHCYSPQFHEVYIITISVKSTIGMLREYIKDGIYKRYTNICLDQLTLWQPMNQLTIHDVTPKLEIGADYLPALRTIGDIFQSGVKEHGIHSIIKITEQKAMIQLTCRLHCVGLKISFKIDVYQNDTLGTLKRMIKGHFTSDLNKLPGYKANLWVVDIPENYYKEYKDTNNFRYHPQSKYLPLNKTVAEVFLQPPTNKHIHIILEVLHVPKDLKKSSNWQYILKEYEGFENIE